jgi:hypothetical protein
MVVSGKNQQRCALYGATIGSEEVIKYGVISPYGMKPG